MPAIPLSTAIESMAGALLVGLLIGVQRETTHQENDGGEPIGKAVGELPGLRDFLLIALAGGVCGLLGSSWLTASVLISITALLAVFHYEERQDRKGITTELAGITAFALAYLAASPEPSFAEPVAIAITILVVTFLETKKRIQTLVRETITIAEFNATLAFLCVVAVIYPLLPAGAFGPYAFFQPRQVWMFVILISSISYLGYFFEKFLGEERGLFYTSVLGGLASTTAATMHFAHESKLRSEGTSGSQNLLELWRAFIIANTVQFPRTLLIVLAASPELARVCVWPLGAMFVTGAVLAEVLRHGTQKPIADIAMSSGNPFRILPALRFGALFAGVVFLSKAATARLGMDAFYGTSLLGGLVDVSTVIAPASDLLKNQHISMATAEIAVLLALAANAVQKILVAAISGTLPFATRAAATFALWAATGAATWWIGFKI